MKRKQDNETGSGTGNFTVVAIGASAAGLDALKKLLLQLTPQARQAYIIYQHSDPGVQSLLPELLQRETMLRVIAIQKDTILQGGTIFILPSAYNLVIKDNQLQPTPKIAGNLGLHGIDHLFTTVAELYQSQAVGILLSGMGSDGTLGLEKIKDYGGVTIVQKPTPEKLNAMPQHAIDAGVADFELLPEEMAGELQHITAKMLEQDTNLEPGDAKAEAETYYNQIHSFLRQRREVDFTHYKQSTIRRRILRRMVINRIESLQEYARFLESNFTELDTLYNDLLIPVTSFFRDEHAFGHLCDKIFPDMFRNRTGQLPVRIWVAGCSTGEEAYSMAICLHEFLGENAAGMRVQLFATDLSETAIRKARSGIYTRREMEGVSADRLQHYFTKIDGHYQVKKNIRDLCVFATHNFLSDPPFAKMDLLSCRNVLIYMDSYLQHKAMTTFHYALNENGVLLLGKSETAGNASDLFKPLGKLEKSFLRKPGTARPPRILQERVLKHPPVNTEAGSKQKARMENFDKNADDILLSRYVPAAVVVNEHFDIVQFRGDTGPFLGPSPGKASFNILKMAREGLSFELRGALQKCREQQKTISKQGLAVPRANFTVDIEITPLLQTPELHFLIVFRQAFVQKPGYKTSGRTKANEQEKQRIQQLETELVQLREDMRAITENQEVVNDELQGANEELLSGSEELQSMNEELESSKEELQSTNEELVTVNQELYDRNEQYNLSRLYAEAIVNTIREPLLVLNRDLRVRSANPAFYEIFSLTEEETHGKILFQLQQSKWDIPELRTNLLKIQTGELPQLEWQVNFPFPQKEERIFLLKAQPVKPENSYPLILLAFEDVTLQVKETERLRRSAEHLKKELQLIEKFFITAPALFCILKGPDHIFEFANPRYEEVTGALNLKGRPFADVFPEHADNFYKSILDEVYRTGKPFAAKAIPALRYGNKNKNDDIYVDLNCQAFEKQEGGIEGVLFFSYEVTSLVQALGKVEANKEKLEQLVADRTLLLQQANLELEHSNRDLQGFASIASHDLQEPLRKIRTFIARLQKQLPSSSSGDILSLMDKTDKAAERMATLIKGVLNYSRLSHHAMGFTAVDLQEVLQQVLTDFEVMIQEKSAAISIEGHLPVIDAIGPQMNQLFYNLIGNALKFSSADIAPQIRITAEKFSGDQLVHFDGLQPEEAYIQIVFSDNGIGFDPQYAEQIFSIFERLDNSYDGTGIGLALCRQLVERHRGSITAENHHNKGSSFKVILPITQLKSTN